MTKCASWYCNARITRGYFGPNRLYATHIGSRHFALRTAVLIASLCLASWPVASHLGEAGRAGTELHHQEGSSAGGISDVTERQRAIAAANVPRATL